MAGVAKSGLRARAVRRRAACAKLPPGAASAVCAAPAAPAKPTLEKLCVNGARRPFLPSPRQEAGAALIMAAKKRAPDSGRRLIDAFLALHNHLVKLCPWQPAQVCTQTGVWI